MDRIAEQVAAELIAQGWVLQYGIFNKVIIGWGQPGVMVPDGRRKVYLKIDEAGRWFERVDAFGALERDVDLRECANAAEAIAAILQK